MGISTRLTRRHLGLVIAATAVAGVTAAFVLPSNPAPQAAEPSQPAGGLVPTLPPLPPISPSTGSTAAPQQSPGAPATTRAVTRSHATSYERVRWSFDSGPAGWQAADHSAISSTRSPVESGAGALAIRNNTTRTETIGATSGPRTPAKSGMRVSGTLAVHAASTVRTVSVTIAFLSASGGTIDQAVGQDSSDSVHTWSDTFTAIGVAPPGTAYAVMSVAFAGASAGETHYVDNAVLAELPGSSAAVVGPLRTAGTRILDARGHTVILRGFTRIGLEGADADPPTADDIAHAKQWGANVIRLPIGEQFWLRSSCHYRPGFAAQVDDAVRLVTDLGMVALLDLHWNSLTSCGAYGQQPMADYPGAINFWQQVATRYKNNPLVAFDLYNEPHNITDQVWRYGGDVEWNGQTFHAAGMQQMYTAVRDTGARNLVIVSGQRWGNLWPSTAPLAGINIVYGIHAYTCPLRPPPNCDNASPYDPSQYFKYWSAAGAQVPVAVTEFGWPNPKDGRYVTAVTQYAAARGWGWTAFSWANTSWGAFSFLAAAGPDSNYEPQPTGEALLAAFPGS